MTKPKRVDARTIWDLDKAFTDLPEEGEEDFFDKLFANRKTPL